MAKSLAIVARLFGVVFDYKGPSYGAAILAMVGAEEYETVGEATAKLINRRENVAAMFATVAQYEEEYQRCRKLYPALKTCFNDGGKMI